jgi:hypothetical protein
MGGVRSGSKIWAGEIPIKPSGAMHYALVRASWKHAVLPQKYAVM